HGSLTRADLARPRPSVDPIPPGILHPAAIRDRDEVELRDDVARTDRVENGPPLRLVCGAGRHGLEHEEVRTRQVRKDRRAGHVEPAGPEEQTGLLSLDPERHGRSAPRTPYRTQRDAR